jgi:hypothetical protein
MEVHINLPLYSLVKFPMSRRWGFTFIVYDDEGSRVEFLQLCVGFMFASIEEVLTADITVSYTGVSFLLIPIPKWVFCFLSFIRWKSFKVSVELFLLCGFETLAKLVVEFGV